ncbi:hypothetical protein C0584_00020 [Candidatus Parcubacteria bacterium]|nr:MAG: hypothetical protein C0584_00020 [Candidatus Parcubacteria bacterium]
MNLHFFSLVPIVLDGNAYCHNNLKYSLPRRSMRDKNTFLHVKKINDTIKQNLWRLALPTVLRVDGFRFFFFSDEHLPLHIHVEKGDGYMRVA